MASPTAAQASLALPDSAGDHTYKIVTALAALLVLVTAAL